MVQICEGVKTKNDVIIETLTEYRDVFNRTRQQMAAFVAVRLSVPSTVRLETDFLTPIGCPRLR